MATARKCFPLEQYVDRVGVVWVAAGCDEIGVPLNVIRLSRVSTIIETPPFGARDCVAFLRVFDAHSDPPLMSVFQVISVSDRIDKTCNSFQRGMT